jgi:hypothetical protein
MRLPYQDLHVIPKGRRFAQAFRNACGQSFDRRTASWTAINVFRLC